MGQKIAESTPRFLKGDELLAAMQRAGRDALRLHKKNGVPAVVWDYETQSVVRIAPEDIPDFPEDGEAAPSMPAAGPGQTKAAAQG